MIPPTLLAEAEAKIELFKAELRSHGLHAEHELESLGKVCLDAMTFMFTRLCEMSDASFDENAAFKPMFARGYDSEKEPDARWFIEGARHQHALNQAALLKARASYHQAAHDWDEMAKAQARIEELEAKVGDNEKFLGSDDCYYWTPEAAKRMREREQVLVAAVRSFWPRSKGCEHDMEPNTTMDYFRCDKCGLPSVFEQALL